MTRFSDARGVLRDVKKKLQKKIKERNTACLFNTIVSAGSTRQENGQSDRSLAYPKKPNVDANSEMLP